MKLWVKNTLHGLVPASRDDFDKRQSAKLKINEYYFVDVTKPRNIKHHQKFFVLMKICFNNQEMFKNKDDLREYLTKEAGYTREVETPKGIEIKALSISFASMDQIAFDKFYEKMIYQTMLFLGVGDETLIQEINSF